MGLLEPHAERQALYAHYLERAGHVVLVVKVEHVDSLRMKQSKLCVVSLPESMAGRLDILRKLQGLKTHCPLYILDIYDYSPDHFLGLPLVGHINRTKVSLALVLSELEVVLKNLQK